MSNLFIVIALFLVSVTLSFTFVPVNSFYQSSALFGRKNQRSAYPPDTGLSHGQTVNYGGGDEVRKTEKKRRRKFAHLKDVDWDAIDRADVDDVFDVVDDDAADPPPPASTAPTTTFMADESIDSTRIDTAIHTFNSAISRTLASKMLKNSLVLVNNKVVKKSYVVQLNDEITLVDDGSTNAASSAFSFAPENIPLDILYEDAAVIVLNKQPGLVVHPAAGNWNGTLINALLHHFEDGKEGWLVEFGGAEAEDNERFRPGIVHRLDKDTSGVMVVAKTTEALQSLASQFQNRQVKKTYER